MGLKVRYYFQCCLILGIIWQVLGKISCPLSDESEVMGEPSYFYPFGNSTNDTFALRNDDGSTGMIPISVLFPYFDENHGELTVNTNGALSFLIDVPTFTPDAFPLPDSQRIIAVFWADVDNTLNLEGFISYRETTEAEILDRASCDVRRHFVQFMNFQATWAFIATWHRVTFFGGNEFTPENSFQAVLVTDGLRSFAIFNYGNITWTTGTASGGNNEGLGGTEAQAGFNAGDGIRYAVIPGSRTPEIVNIDTLPGNLDVGRWIFRIDDENVNVGMCGMGGNIMIGPRTGLIYGGTEIFIAGPCFDNTTDIICKFNGIIVPGEIVGLQLARCISPFMTEADQAVTLELSLDDGQNFSTAYYIVESDPEYEVRRLGGDIWMEDPFFPLVIEWNPSTLDGSEYVRVDLISLGSFDPLSTAVPLLNSTLNSGTATLPFGLPDAWDPSSYIYYGIIRVSPAEQNGTQESLWSEPHDTDWYNQALVQEINTRFVTGQYLSPEALEIYAEIVQAMEMDNPSDNTGRKKRALPVIAAFLVRAFVRRIVIRAAAEVHCRAWDVVERFNPPDWSDVIPPPCTVRQARKNPLFEQDKACHSDSIFGRLGCFFFHRGASVCFRSRTPAPNGARQQSCYDAAGNLITDASIGGGTLDRASGLVGHFVHDVIPFLTCCKLTNNCQKYYDNRPTSNCDDYDGPDCAWTGGDPHIMTPDSFSYTFNGHGEYRLVNHTNFKFQGRFTPFQGLSVDATVITAVVIGKGDNRVQVEVGNTQALEVRLNGERQMLDDFGNESVPIVEGVTLQRNNDRKVTVTFTGPSACSGETITVTEMEKTLNVVTVLPSCYSGNISGLLGNFDGDPSNDLMTPSGEIIDPASNLSHIHFAFGELWRVSEEESMFTYPPGQVHTDFQDESFIPAFPAINPDTQGICMNNTFCQFDLVVTGNDNFALGTLETNEQIVREITDLERGFDACSGQPCENGGQCTVNSNDTYTCICMDGFAGENCTIVTNLCECVNGGTCMDDGSCACLPGFTGRKCDQVFESCNDMTSLCNNGGFCQSAGDCVCPTGFRGERCDIAFMPCNGSCMNNGTCRLDGTCICTMNYTGQMCETKIQPCNSSLCMNGGVCLPSGRCSCPDTHVGAQCEATRACVSSPCNNNGSCFDIDATFYCSCSSGFTGATCDTVVANAEGPRIGSPD